MKTLAALLVLLSAGTLYAADLPPHAERTWGGWISCESGYVIRGNECVSVEAVRAESFEVSALPSAGDGAPGTCPSGGCPVPAPRIVYSAPREYRPEWSYEGPNPGGGATFTRSVGGGRQVVIVPTWPW